MKKDINAEKEKSNSSPRILLRDLFRCGYAPSIRDGVLRSGMLLYLHLILK